jgi:hypothetical protein
VFLLSSCDDKQSKEERIEELVEQLDSRSWRKREAASKELAEIGFDALPELTKNRKEGTPEMRRRVEQLIHKIFDQVLAEGNNDVRKGKLDRIKTIDAEALYKYLLKIIADRVPNEFPVSFVRASSIIHNASNTKLARDVLAEALNNATNANAKLQLLQVYKRLIDVNIEALSIAAKRENALKVLIEIKKTLQAFQKPGLDDKVRANLEDLLWKLNEY